MGSRSAHGEGDSFEGEKGPTQDMSDVSCGQYTESNSAGGCYGKV